MKNLKIDGGGSGLDGVVKILRQAFNGAEVMDSAYGGLSKVTSGERVGVEVSMGELNARNGAKFLHHTLMGAKALEFLALTHRCKFKLLAMGL